MGGQCEAGQIEQLQSMGEPDHHRLFAGELEALDQGVGIERVGAPWRQDAEAGIRDGISQRQDVDFADVSTAPTEARVRLRPLASRRRQPT